MFTTDELERVAQDGFVVHKALLSTTQCESLCARHSAVIHREAKRTIANEVELDFWKLMPRSAHEVVVFWDLSNGTPAKLPAEKWESYAMRVGHGLHERDPEFKAIAHSTALSSAFGELIGGPFELVQSAVIDKHPHSTSVQFGLHQDSWYLTTEPDTLWLAFIALDDMDADNGCLEIVPRSHRLPLATQYRLGPDGFVAVDGRALGRPPAGAVPIPLARGDAIFLRGRTYHGSAPNHSARRRRALIIHAMSATSKLARSTWITTK